MNQNYPVTVVFKAPLLALIYPDNYRLTIKITERFSIAFESDLTPSQKYLV